MPIQGATSQLKAAREIPSQHRILLCGKWTK